MTKSCKGIPWMEALHPPMGLPTGKKGIYNRIVHVDPGVAVL